MSDGNTHNGVTTFTAITVMVVGVWSGFNPKDVVALSVGCMSGILLTPDLDQAEAHRGPWASIWWLYGKLLPHRSPLSHLPILGTFLRVMYLGGVGYLVYWFISARYPIHIIVDRDIILLWMVGLMIVDTLHWIVDMISTSGKMANARKGRRYQDD